MSTNGGLSIASLLREKSRKSGADKSANFVTPGVAMASSSSADNDDHIDRHVSGHNSDVEGDAEEADEDDDFEIGQEKGSEIECIPLDEQDLFRAFCANLLACADPVLQYPLMCSVLLHWDEMYRDVPEHHIFGRMMSAGVTAEKIHEWILCVRRRFRDMNAPFLPVSALEPTDSVPYSTIQEFFAKTIETLNLVRTQLSEEVMKREESDRRARVEAERAQRIEDLLMEVIAGTGSVYYVLYLNAPRFVA